MKTLTIDVPGYDDDVLMEDLCSLEFHHYQDSRLMPFSADKVNLFLMRGATSCAVVLESGEVFLGYAWCYRKDRFDKRRGEREALRKALEEARLHQVDRAWVWRWYLKARPVLKALKVLKGPTGHESSTHSVTGSQSTHRRKEDSPKSMV